MTTPEQLFAFWIAERHTIYLKRQERKPAPWTTDHILGEFRFCNVYRSLDKVSLWINTYWLKNRHPLSMPFNAIVGRFLNLPESLNAVQYTNNTWDPDKFVRVLNARKAADRLIRNTAYIVSTNGLSIPFPEYITGHVLNHIWAERHKLVPEQGQTLAAYCELLQTLPGLGSFLAGQVVADLKLHHPVLAGAPDWHAFVVPGPGSKRGLNRLHGLPHDAAMTTRKFHDMFGKAWDIAQKVATRNGWPFIDAQDAQNCLCEFDKYERARLGQGKPKQHYTPPSTDNLVF